LLGVLEDLVGAAVYLAGVVIEDGVDATTILIGVAVIIITRTGVGVDDTDTTHIITMEDGHHMDTDGVQDFGHQPSQ